MIDQFTGITSEKYPIPKMMKAWVLGDPEQISLVEKPIEMPNKAEVLVRIDAVAICATHRAMAFMNEGRFDAKIVHTHTFNMNELPTALKYARERIDGAIKVVIKPWS